MSGFVKQLDRRQRAVIAGAALAALALVLYLVTGQTRAAFVDQTENAGNLFETGSVDISTGTASAIFDFADAGVLLPGHTVDAEIEVINNSRADLDVKLFTGAFVELPDTSSGIAENLNLTIELVDALGGNVTGTVYQGTVADFGSNATDWTSGKSAQSGGDVIPSVDDAPANQQVYRFTIQLDPGAGRESQNVNPNDNVTITFTWEGRA